MAGQKEKWGANTAAGGLAVQQCVSDIEVADFVAVDLEFSGLFLQTERDKDALTLDGYFKKCVDSIPHFLPIQLGLCCGRLLPSSSGGAAGGTPTWELRTHQFNLWPSDRRLFTSDLQSLRFLRAHGFDFNAYFERGHAYSRLPEAADGGQATSKSKEVSRLPPSHANRVLVALRDAQVPVIVHNGLLDLMHIYDKFLGPLPEAPGAFGAAWASHFPHLFDTRLIGHEGRYVIFGHSGSLSLEALHSHLRPTARALRFQRARSEALDQAASTDQAHGSSAFDALLTAEVFLMQVDRWIRSEEDGGGGGKKRQRAAAPTHQPAAAAHAEACRTDAAAGLEGPITAGCQEPSADAQADAAGVGVLEDNEGWTVVGQRGQKRTARGVAVGTEVGRALTGGLSSASLLETHPVCVRFRNRIALMGASPGHMRLGARVQEPLGAEAPAQWGADAEFRGVPR